MQLAKVPSSALQEALEHRESRQKTPQSWERPHLQHLFCIVCSGEMLINLSLACTAVIHKVTFFHQK